MRNAASLIKPRTQDEITAIKLAIPMTEAHRFAVIDADAYIRDNETLRLREGLK